MVNPVSIFSQSGTQQGSEGQLRKQAEDLEGVFLTTLTKEMFKGIDSHGSFGGGFAEETWRSMQSEQFAASMAASGGIGLADQLVDGLLAVQQAAIPGTPQ